MLNSITGSPVPNLLTAPSTRQATSSGSTASFTDQLAATLEGFLNQSANGSHLEIDIQSTQSQDSGVRQFLVTVKDPASTADSVHTPAQASSSPANTVADPAADPAPPANPLAEVDAYWAAQPEEVQALRNIQDPNLKAQLAQDLAEKGYSIDRAIMLWGWDPLKTMVTRQMYGYTWVPSMNQATPPAAPGFALPGQTRYDPATPPPGSIAVNTDFAKGLGITDPWA
jgi:hypothetical protein